MKNNTMKLTFQLTSIFLMTFSMISFAKPVNTDYFVDHAIVSQGKSLTVEYSFPTPDHVLECHQDVPASHIGSVEWSYKGTSFKGQIGDSRSLKLLRDDSSTWWNGKQGQTADAAGKLVFTNLDSEDLFVTCSYNSPRTKA
jgi:hypothetical protein